MICQAQSWYSKDHKAFFAGNVINQLLSHEQKSLDLLLFNLVDDKSVELDKMFKEIFETQKNNIQIITEDKSIAEIVVMTPNIIIILIDADQTVLQINFSLFMYLFSIILGCVRCQNISLLVP